MVWVLRLRVGRSGTGRNAARRGRAIVEVAAPRSPDARVPRGSGRLVVRVPASAVAAAGAVFLSCGFFRTGLFVRVLPRGRYAGKSVRPARVLFRTVSSVR